MAVTLVAVFKFLVTVVDTADAAAVEVYSDVAVFICHLLISGVFRIFTNTLGVY